MTQKMARLIGAASGLLVAILLGCQPMETAQQDSDHEVVHDEHGEADDDHGHTHEHADGPQSFHEAVAQLKEIQTEVTTAMENDDPDAAHGPLHDVGHLLNKIPELAADTDLAESDWNEVKAEAERLFEAFGEVDSAFHNDGEENSDDDKQAAYESAKSTIDDGIANLEAKLALAGPNTATSDHEHEESDHGHGESDHEHDESDHEHDEEQAEHVDADEHENGEE